MAWSKVEEEEKGGVGSGGEYLPTEHGSSYTKARGSQVPSLGISKIHPTEHVTKINRQDMLKLYNATETPKYVKVPSE